MGLSKSFLFHLRERGVTARRAAAGPGGGEDDEAWEESTKETADD